MAMATTGRRDVSSGGGDRSKAQAALEGQRQSTKAARDLVIATVAATDVNAQSNVIWQAILAELILIREALETPPGAPP